jgi:hypothetical protein
VSGSKKIPNIRYDLKIISANNLNHKRLLVRIVVIQNIMKHLNTLASYFNRAANVGNLVSVLVIVIILVLKPAGAMMV